MIVEVLVVASQQNLSFKILLYIQWRKTYHNPCSVRVALIKVAKTFIEIDFFDSNKLTCLEVKSYSFCKSNYSKIGFFMVINDLH